MYADIVQSFLEFQLSGLTFLDTLYEAFYQPLGGNQQTRRQARLYGGFREIGRLDAPVAYEAQAWQGRLTGSPANSGQTACAAQHNSASSTSSDESFENLHRGHLRYLSIDLNWFLV